MEDPIPQREGALLRGKRKKCNNVAAAFAVKGIIQSPITSCSRRDHSICQASAYMNLENSERRRYGVSAEKGRRECIARAKYDIYDIKYLIPASSCKIQITLLKDLQKLTHSNEVQFVCEYILSL